MFVLFSNHTRWIQFVNIFWILLLCFNYLLDDCPFPFCFFLYFLLSIWLSISEAGIYRFVGFILCFRVYVETSFWIKKVTLFTFYFNSSAFKTNKQTKFNVKSSRKTGVRTVETGWEFTSLPSSCLWVFGRDSASSGCSSPPVWIWDWLVFWELSGMRRWPFWGFHWCRLPLQMKRKLNGCQKKRTLFIGRADSTFLLHFSLLLDGTLIGGVFFWFICCVLSLCRLLDKEKRHKWGGIQSKSSQIWILFFFLLDDLLRNKSPPPSLCDDAVWAAILPLLSFPFVSLRSARWAEQIGEIITNKNQSRGPLTFQEETLRSRRNLPENPNKKKKQKRKNKSRICWYEDEL